MLIREMDFAFDLIRHGSWLWLALAVKIAAIFYAGRDPQRTLAGLVIFFKHPSYGMLSAGLLTVLLFARLMWMGTLWHTLLADDFIRTVKNAVEEDTELFGYALCLLATLRISTPSAVGMRLWLSLARQTDNLGVPAAAAGTFVYTKERVGRYLISR